MAQKNTEPTKSSLLSDDPLKIMGKGDIRTSIHKASELHMSTRPSRTKIKHVSVGAVTPAVAPAAVAGTRAGARAGARGPALLDVLPGLPVARATVWAGRLLGVAALLHVAGVDKAGNAFDALGPQGMAVLVCVLFLLWVQEVYGAILKEEEEISSNAKEEFEAAMPRRRRSHLHRKCNCSVLVDAQLPEDISGFNASLRDLSSSREKLKKVEQCADDLLRSAIHLTQIVSPKMTAVSSNQSKISERQITINEYPEQ